MSDKSFATSLMSHINKEMKDEIAFLIEDGSPSDVEIFISTGSSVLDYIISNQKNGGIPVGKITEISGLEGTGKTLLAMQICANTQKMGGIPIFIDTEHAFNSDFARRVGLDTSKNFMYITPSCVEDVFSVIFNIIHRLDKQEKEKGEKVPFVTLVWDSVAATPPKADIDDENPDPTATVGLKPRILSKNIYSLLRMTGRKKIAQVFLNQLRTNIRAQPFQDPYVTPGGKAIPFASSIRIRLMNAGKVKAKDSIVGIQAKAKCVKTRFGPPYRVAEFPIYFTHGVDDLEGTIDILVKNDKILKKKGGEAGRSMGYYFKGDSEDLRCSKVDLKQKILQDPTLQKKVETLLEEVLTVPMVDPMKAELEIVDPEKEEETK